MITGAIEAISEKNRSFKVNGAWFNPETPDVGAKLLLMSDQLRGKIISITPGTTQNSYADFHIEGSSQETLKKEEYWQNKEERDIARDKRQLRHHALNTAIELAKLRSNKVYTTEQLTEMAEGIIKWIEGA